MSASFSREPGINAAPVSPSLFVEASLLDEHDEPRSAWNHLALRTVQPDPFCSTTPWQLSFREVADPNRRVTLRQCGDGLVQFALHSMRERPALGPIERSWLFGCNVLGPAGPALLEEVVADVLRAGVDCPHFGVSGLDPSGPLLGALKIKFAHRFRLQRFSSGVQCAASLEGGLDGFLSRRSANHRKKLRQSLKRALEAGIHFERLRPASVEVATAAFDRMLVVEQNSWKGIPGCGMNSRGSRQFYAAMLRRMSPSQDARIIFASHQGRDVGYIFGGMAGDIYRGQQFSFDVAYAQMSVGNLLQFEQVRWLCEDGAQRYDMGPLLGPSMAYKYHWTELQLPIEAWAILSG